MESSRTGVIKKNIPTGIRIEGGAKPTATTYEIIKTVRREINKLMENPDYGYLLYLQQPNDVYKDVPDGFTAVISTIGGSQIIGISFFC